MSENTVVITEKNGKYEVRNNGISELALLGILECLAFEIKSANRQVLLRAAAVPEREQESVEEAPPKPPEPETPAPNSNSPELRTRIANAIKAISGLGGETPDFDVENATDEELQNELAALTDQYKRLKNSKAPKK